MCYAHICRMLDVPILLQQISGLNQLTIQKSCPVLGFANRHPCPFHQLARNIVFHSTLAPTCKFPFFPAILTSATAQ